MPSPTTRPTDLPTWAESPGAPADVVEPPQPTQDAGWTFRFPPPYTWFNWWQRQVGRWLANFSATVSTFADLGDAPSLTGAPLAVGDTCFVDEWDATAADLSRLGSVIDTGTATDVGAAIAATGEGAILCYSPVTFSVGDALTLVHLDRSGTVDATFAGHSSVKPFFRPTVWTDGDIVVLGGRSTIDAWDLGTPGTRKWFASFAAIGGGGTADPLNFSENRALAGDATHIYVSDEVNLEARLRTTGAVQWTYDHGGTIKAVVSDGTWVYLIGEASSYPSGANLRKIRAADGYDFDNESAIGGTAAGAWNVVTVVDPTYIDACRMGLTKTSVVICMQAAGGATGRVESAGKLTGGIEWTTTAYAGAALLAFDVSVDQDWIYVSDLQSSGRVLKMEPYGGRVVEHWNAELATHMSLASDGAAFWAAGNYAAGQAAKHYRDKHPQRFRRVDPSAASFVPLAQLVVPAE